MANKVLLKKSSVAAKIPLVTDLDYGELAINYTDEKLYFKNASNAIKSFTAPNNGTLTLNVSGTGLSGSQTFTADQSTNATFTVTSNATSANTASTIVARDGSGNFTAGTVTAALSGNASTATTLQTSRTIGDVSFNGSANIVPERITFKDTRAVNYNPTTYPGVTLHLKTNTTDSLNDGGTYHGILNLQHWSDLSGGKVHQIGLTDNNNIFIRGSVDATTWDSWVKVWTDANDGAASGLDADLLDGQQGSYYLDWTNVTNKPDPVVTVTLTGDVTGTANTTLTDLASGTVSVATTIAANSVALGTDTTGNYVAGLTAGTGITISGTAGEGWSPTVTHSDTSTQASVDNANGTVIQDITLDGFGHITGIGSVDLDGRYYTETEADNRFVNVTGDTMTGSLVHGLNLAAKFGDTVADNYSDVYHYSGTAGVDHIGFPNQHGNAFVIINQQGSTNQSLILGDTDNGTGTGVLFGIGHTSDGGTNWSKRIELLGTGSFKRDGNLIWDAGNDGAASGLDADLLDGQHGSYYLDWTNVTNKPDPQITVTLTGDVTGTANTTLTDLASGTVSVATTIAANSVALGTDTTGNYVAGLTAGTGITITGTAGEGWSPTVTNSAPNVTTDISITHNASTVVVNSSDGADGTINAATTSLAGVMTAADKTKLDGIATGAQTNQNAFSNVAVSGQTTVAADSTTDTLTLVAGTNVTITTNATTDSITISATDTNTTYTGSKGITLSGTDFRITGNEIPGSIDLNTYRTTGFYAQNANADASSGTNYPTANAGILQVINDDYGNGLHTTQLYSQYNSTNYYHRTYYNGGWTAWRNLAQDTDTTYSKATSTTLGLVELGSDTVQTVAANAVTATASRTYAVQLNAADQMVVNIPWTDTTYTVGNGTLGVSIGTAGATNTTVTWGTATGFSANTSTNYTYDIKVGPALTALASTMTGAGTGFIRKNGADTYSLDTNTYLTAEADTLATVTGRGASTSTRVTLSGGITSSDTSTRDKISVWSDTGNYVIGMQNSITFGAINNNYAMTFQMNNDSARGFWWGDAGHTTAQGAMSLSTNGLLTVASGARIGFGESDTTLPTANVVEINGALLATSKSFLIKHPTKEGKKLRHGSLEGPEHGVYVRGKMKGNIIELPEYWTKLVDHDSITVQLTAIGKGQKLYVEDIRDNKVYIANDGMFASEPHCFYLVQAERVDIEKMQVEIVE